jgi:ribosomal protein L7Ae-like RNA K-turn-binding protein
LSPYQYVVISVDVENKRIGLCKQELAKVPNASAIKIDKRGYLGTRAGKEVVRKLAISSDALPIKFADIGFVDENGVRWRGFEVTE